MPYLHLEKRKLRRSRYDILVDALTSAVEKVDMPLDEEEREKHNRRLQREVFHMWIFDVIFNGCLAVIEIISTELFPLTVFTSFPVFSELHYFLPPTVSN